MRAGESITYDKHSSDVNADPLMKKDVHRRAKSEKNRKKKKNTNLVRCRRTNVLEQPRIYMLRSYVVGRLYARSASYSHARQVELENSLEGG